MTTTHTPTTPGMWPTREPDPAPVSVPWRGRQARLLDQLAATGFLSRGWAAVADQVPRHQFVPEFWAQDQTGYWARHTPSEPDALAHIYTDAPLVAVLDDEGVPSCTVPGVGLAGRMLTALDPEPDDSVLHVGVGTGWVTGLLCAALGGHCVFGADVAGIEHAQRCLAALGHAPTLVAADAITARPFAGMVDRILGTVAVPAIPPLWSQQLRPGGRIVTDLRPTPSAGNLVSLTRHGDFLHGRFDTAGHDWFLTRPATSPAAGTELRAAGEGWTRLPAAPWTHPVPWLLACLSMPGPVTATTRVDVTGTVTAVELRVPDGSWVSVDTNTTEDTRRWRGGGSTPIWAQVEDTHRLWRELGSPGWDRLGITVGPDLQWVWIDDSLSPHRWHLPTLTAAPARTTP